jgi:putative glutamine amidotransferase
MTDTKPLIGLTGRRGTGRTIGSPQGFASSELEIYFSDYSKRVLEAGGLPLHLPMDAEPRSLIHLLDGLLVSGGEDVSPSFYSQEPGVTTGPSSRERDEFELELIDLAVANGVPILGICRGSQILNVYRGGSLIQHLEESTYLPHMSSVRDRSERSHTVLFEPGSLLHSLYGESQDVNSFHHQAIDTLGLGVTATAKSDDGVIEAIEFDDHAAIAFQWHPEVFAHDPIFRWLTEQGQKVHQDKQRKRT